MSGNEKLPSTCGSTTRSTPPSRTGQPAAGSEHGYVGSPKSPSRRPFSGVDLLSSPLSGIMRLSQTSGSPQKSVSFHQSSPPTRSGVGATPTSSGSSQTVFRNTTVRKPSQKTSATRQWLEAKGMKFFSSGRTPPYEKFCDVDIGDDVLPAPALGDFDEARKVLQKHTPCGLVLSRLFVCRKKTSRYSWMCEYTWKNNSFPNPCDFNIVHARAMFQRAAPKNAQVGTVVTLLHEGGSMPKWSQQLYVVQPPDGTLSGVVRRIVDYAVPGLASSSQRPHVDSVLGDVNNIFVRTKHDADGVRSYRLTELIPSDAVLQKVFYGGYDVTRLIFGKTRICWLDVQKLRSGATAGELRPVKSSNIRRWQLPFVDAVRRYVRHASTRNRVADAGVAPPVVDLNSDPGRFGITSSMSSRAGDRQMSVELESMCALGNDINKMRKSTPLLSVAREHLFENRTSLCGWHKYSNPVSNRYPLRHTQRERSSILSSSGLACTTIQSLWNVYLASVGFSHDELNDCTCVIDEIVGLMTHDDRQRAPSDSYDLMCTGNRSA